MIMKSADKDTHYLDTINQKAQRRLKAQRQQPRHIWLGLGMIGIIGWSIAVPTLLGLALGLWLDNAFPGAYIWTLNLLILGMLIGCLIAWRWVSNEYKEMNKDEQETK